jgi:hypothetical protein
MLPPVIKEMEDGSSSPVGKGRAEHYKGRVTVHVVIACIVAATGGSLFGYDVGISGSVIIIPSLSNFCFTFMFFCNIFSLIIKQISTTCLFFNIS